MTAKPPPLEPIEWRLWKNRWRRAAIVISLNHFEGNNVVDVREFFTDAAGCNQPTRKGLTLSVRKLKELSRALVKAEAKARELGLLDDESEGSE